MKSVLLIVVIFSVHLLVFIENGKECVTASPVLPNANTSSSQISPPVITSSQVAKRAFYEVFFARLPSSSISSSSSSSSSSVNVRHKKGFVYSSVHNLNEKKQESSYGAPVSGSVTQVTSVSATEVVAPPAKANTSSKAQRSISRLLATIV